VLLRALLSFPGAALHHWPGTRDWRATAGRALGGEIASPLVLEPDPSCHDMLGGLGDAETARGRRLVLNIQGCPGNASPKPKSGSISLACRMQLQSAVKKNDKAHVADDECAASPYNKNTHNKNMILRDHQLCQL
jgi:hypothetical protein